MKTFKVVLTMLGFVVGTGFLYFISFMLYYSSMGAFPLSYPIFS